MRKGEDDDVVSNVKKNTQLDDTVQRGTVGWGPDDKGEIIGEESSSSTVVAPVGSSENYNPGMINTLSPTNYQCLATPGHSIDMCVMARTPHTG